MGVNAGTRLGLVALGASTDGQGAADLDERLAEGFGCGCRVLIVDMVRPDDIIPNG